MYVAKAQRKGGLTKARSLKELSLPHHDTLDSTLFAGMLLVVVGGCMGVVRLELH